MKKINTKYQVELSVDEVEILVDVLNRQYKHIKALLENSENEKKDYKKICEQKDSVRYLRNEFASFINRFFMGEDA